MLPWVSAAHGRSEYLRLRSVVDALVRIAEHAGDTQSFLDDATATVMELTRATGAAVLIAGSDGTPLHVASVRGQMQKVPVDAFATGQTLAAACLKTHQALHSGVTLEDERIQGVARRRHALHSLIATPLRFGEDVLGVLEICSSVAQAFDEIDAQAVALIGNALGGSLGRQMALDDNAQLLAQLEASLERSRAQARQYQDAALYDGLTGLPNRAHFMARLEEACARSGEGDFAVLFLDLDGFKATNDTYGHATGDAVLKAAADTLRASLRESDLIARLGGDEFVVLLAGPRHGEQDVAAIAAALVDALARPRDIGGRELGIEASVGWVVYDGAAGQSTLLARADAAMYEHKKARRTG